MAGKRPRSIVRQFLWLHLGVFTALLLTLAVAWRAYWPAVPYLIGLQALPVHPLYQGQAEAGGYQGRTFRIALDADVAVTEAGDDDTWMTTFAWGETARFWLIETNEPWGPRDFVSGAGAEDASESQGGVTVAMVTLNGDGLVARARTYALETERPPEAGLAQACTAALGLEAHLQALNLLSRLPLAESCRVAPVALSWPRAWHVVYQGLTEADAVKADAMIRTLRFDFAGAHSRNALGQAMRPGS